MPGLRGTRGCAYSVNAAPFLRFIQDAVMRRARTTPILRLSAHLAFTLVSTKP